MVWKTKITKVEPNNLITRGYKQEDLIGNIPFSNVIYLTLKGELPSNEHGLMIDAILSACIDHGVTPPSSMAARIVASGGVSLSTAVAAGILSIGDAHGGAIEKAAKYLQEGIIRKRKNENTINEIAYMLVKESREMKKRILGFGHRIHSTDPRTRKLFILADELKITNEHIDLSRAIEKELEKQTGRKLPINVDGAIAAISSDMGFDWRFGKVFFIIGRVVGLSAHVYEEQTEYKPMRKIFNIDCEYEGPEERNI